MNAWLVPVSAGVGLALGAAGSAITKKLLQQSARIARSGWLGAVITAALLALLGWRVGLRGELGGLRGTS